MNKYSKDKTSALRRVPNAGGVHSLSVEERRASFAKVLPDNLHSLSDNRRKVTQRCALGPAIQFEKERCELRFFFTILEIGLHLSPGCTKNLISLHIRCTKK
jgi:hypothetical protein